ncbi:MAG: Uma2 family endonuclease, partial [Blastocatellia bacterium]
ADWGVNEYFMCDPLNEYLRPALQGFRLVNDRYETISADEMGRLKSEELGLWLERDGTRLRLWDAETDAEILDGNERAQIASRRALIAETRIQFELARASQAEARAAAAEAELAKLRDQLERQTKRKK